MKRIMIFSGTTEGRELAERLAAEHIFCDVCVATEYGSRVMEESEFVRLHMGRLDADGMSRMYENCGTQVVVDATHPFATAVSENILSSTKKAGICYLRLERKNDTQEETETANFFEDCESCANALKKTEGRILLTTGSKELAVFCRDEALRSRLVVRILPALPGLAACYENGLEGRQIIAMQGPFDEQMNLATFEQYDIRHMVTKESGRVGGADKKLLAAEKAGVLSWVIRRPTETGGQKTYDEQSIWDVLMASACEECGGGQQVRQSSRADSTGQQSGQSCHLQISLIGIGMGGQGQLTVQASEELSRSDYVFGAKRMLAGLESNAVKYPYYLAKDIIPVLDDIAEKSEGDLRVAILFSGDTGFYSGCSRLQRELAGLPYASVRILPGISSISYLASKAHIGWQDAEIVSTHGVARDQWSSRLLYLALHRRKTFFLTSGASDVQEVGRLLKGEEGQLRIVLGHSLSYPDEEILYTTPGECTGITEEGLYCGFILNDSPRSARALGCFEDDDFIRTSVPMTKEEVRQISVAKLHLKETSVVYDIGCGSGSISAEIAARSPEINVYAVDSEEAAVELTRRNVSALGLGNVSVTRSMAPEGLAELPRATHAFVGGSRGRLSEILQTLRDINPEMRVVVNAVSMETVAELTECLRRMKVRKPDITQVQISKARELGGYHMMTGQNPVLIAAFDLNSGEKETMEQPCEENGGDK